MARFYSNENLPVQVVMELRRLGHDDSSSARGSVECNPTYHSLPSRCNVDASAEFAGVSLPELGIESRNGICAATEEPRIELLDSGVSKPFPRLFSRSEEVQRWWGPVERRLDFLPSTERIRCTLTERKCKDYDNIETMRCSQADCRLMRFESPIEPELL